MSHLAQTYHLPSVIEQFVTDEFLIVVDEAPDKATVEFRIPDLVGTDSSGHRTAYVISWIRPDANAEHCRTYLETPGDLPNFEVTLLSEYGPNEVIDGLETVDDLVGWLEQMKIAAERV